MNAIEIEAPIINHQISIYSERLPAQMSRVRIIVLYDDGESVALRKGALASLRATPAEPKGDGLPMKRE